MGEVEPFKAKKGKDYELAPAGTEIARCVWVIDLGKQELIYQNHTYFARQGLIAFELPDALMESGEPFMVSRIYTMSLSPKAIFRKHIQSWRGREFTDEEINKGFDPHVLLNQTCSVNIVHNIKGDKTYANIEAIVPLPKKGDFKIPKAINKLLYFNFADEKTRPVFQELPEWVQKIIMKSAEWQATLDDPEHFEEEEPEDVQF